MLFLCCHVIVIYCCEVPFQGLVAKHELLELSESFSAAVKDFSR